MRKINETFIHNGKKVKCVLQVDYDDQEVCSQCVFHLPENLCELERPECADCDRLDNKDVYFILEESNE